MKVCLYLYNTCILLYIYKSSFKEKCEIMINPYQANEMYVRKLTTFV